MNKQLLVQFNIEDYDNVTLQLMNRIYYLLLENSKYEFNQRKMEKTHVYSN
jgi:hypothetical protein